MKSKYKVVFFITILLVILSLSISTINYYVSLESAQKHLKNQSLPLSLDNIYSDIQKHIIQPYLVSSMMANDTFLQDWLVNEEHNVNKISRYLENIKNKYHMFNAFLVSEKTKKYYTQNGFLEVLNKNKASNKWYYNFLSTEKKHEINLDFNKYLSNNLIMFINYKILDKDLNLIGVTGLALKISYIDDLLKKFRKKHNFIVTFYNSQGDVVLAEREITKEKNINEIVELKKYKDLILSKKSVLLEYSKGLEQYILNTKYIPELDLYLTVKANLEDFTYDVKKILFFNLFVSLLITFIIATIIYFIIKNYSNKLEFLSNNDALTNVSNRRDFEEKLNYHLNIFKRRKNDISLVFIDIDNFKDLNDKYGHEIGDRVLKRVAEILKSEIRKTDLLARWGGEEFIITLVDSNLESSKKITEKLRVLIQTDIKLKEIISQEISASFGLTLLEESDSLEKLVARADEAMYKAKDNGKNQVCIL